MLRRSDCGLAARVSLVAVLAGLLAGGSVAGGPAGATVRYRYRQPCPRPQRVVAHTHWARHLLAPGVLLSEGSADDRTVYGQPGVVNLHVLRIDLRQSTTQLAPLHDRLTEWSTLSALAAGQQHLIAATNTGFFSFQRYAPLGPVFADGEPVSMSASPSRVIGFSADHRAIAARAWLVGSVQVGSSRRRLEGYNALDVRRGLSLYTPEWGVDSQAPLPAGRHTVLRRVRQGQITGGVLTGARVPSGDTDLLVASTRASERWLRSVQIGQPVAWTTRIASSSSSPLVQGYGVGRELVRRGRARSGLSCNELNSQAARTAVGISKDGKTLLIAVVADDEEAKHDKRQLHGLDHKEMARVMIDLGAAASWEWDGSGSSELIAKLPRHRRLTIRNYCSDGQERPMPVGFGVFTTTR